jgi:hypothetical protein
MFSSNTSSAAGDANYIEDVFSTWLYTGNGSTQTITNGIDLAGKGGLLWVKCRNAAASHRLYDTGRGANQYLNSASTDGTNLTDTGQSFTSTGFQFASNDGTVNDSGRDYVSWTFRDQPKFFDVVTYTGTGSARTVAHSLGSVPGCVIVKSTSVGGAGYDWRVYHRGLTSAAYTIQLNLTSAESNQPSIWNSTAPTSTVFTVGTDISVNEVGQTYVAYLFAHDAGGFGLTGSDNVISCGSFTYNNSVGVSVTLGYEPQWIMYKSSTALGGGTNWIMHDIMRGMPVPPSTTATLAANNSGAESSSFARAYPTANGFTLPSGLGAADDYIYIAIRRGPMKVPTTGTSVFSPVAYAGTGSATTTTSGFVSDLAIIKSRGIYANSFEDRLRGANRVLESTGTGAEIATSQYVLGFDIQNGVRIGTDVGVNGSGTTYIDWMFQRAPGFFDVACYTGTGIARTVTHNLAAVPELMIVKVRDTTGTWLCYSAGSGATSFLALNSTNAATTSSLAWNDTAPTASVFTVGTSSFANGSGNTFVAYLFATCPGVSKVGSYTGTGTTLQINCGFAAGARFVLIKRTDSTGDWYVWDTARGIVAGNDPYLLLNSTAAEVTSTDYIDTFSSGFEISSTAPAAINASGGTFIFLAIA